MHKVTFQRWKDWARLMLGDRHIATIYPEHGENPKLILEIVEKYFEKHLTPGGRLAKQTKKEETK